MQYILTQEEMDARVSREEYDDVVKRLRQSGIIREKALEMILAAHNVKCVNRKDGIEYCELCPVGGGMDGFDVYGICDRKRKYSEQYLQATRLGLR